MNETIDIADLDCVYLTYNEPQAEEFWIKIQNMVPWAVRVDGVKGSDAAHKAAADACDTDRFVLIDGDNMPDPDFFNQQLVLTDSNRDCVFRWKAYNHINGLMYGNGGMSCWTKDFVYNMQTHEASDGSDDTAVEFCYDPKYIAMHDCFSTTYPNASGEQAFRAGFREGVKMCLDKGAKPTLAEFEQRVVSRNYDNLCIWMSIGADVENGDWARGGAMLGTFLTMLGDPNDDYGFKDFDYRNVQDFEYLEGLWSTVRRTSISEDALIRWLEPLLKKRLLLPINSFSSDSSNFFKRHMLRSQYRARGIMVSEMEVIRGIEGW
jgi:hypothetical protein